MGLIFDERIGTIPNSTSDNVYYVRLDLHYALPDTLIISHPVQKTISYLFTILSDSKAQQHRELPG